MVEAKKNVNSSRWKYVFTLKRKDQWIALKQQATMSQLDGKRRIRCR